MSGFVKPIFCVIGRDAWGWQIEFIVDQRRVGLLRRSPPKTMELEKGSGGLGGSLMTRLRAACILYGIAIFAGLAADWGVREMPLKSSR